MKTVSLALVFLLLPLSAQAEFSEDFLSVRQSGCCSSHGGVSSACQSNGHVVCNDGSTGSSCLCSPGNIFVPTPVQHPGGSSKPPAPGKSLAGKYKGNVKVSAFSSFLSLSPKLVPGIDKAAVYLRLRYSPRGLKASDASGNALRVTKVTSTSFLASGQFSVFPSCDVEVRFNVSKITSTGAKLKYTSDMVCDYGATEHIELRGSVARKP